MSPPTLLQPPEVDALRFRRALGQFATGVTVVTTRAADGALVGLTANSFNAVSLSPPLVLWSLGLSARSLPVFRHARRYVINVLSAEQAGICHRFASGTGDRFAATPHSLNEHGLPLIDGALAWFECHSRSQYDEGDHVILVGEVERCTEAPGEPLVFQGGRLGGFAAPAAGGAGHGDAPFVDDYLAYLLARASHRVSEEFHTEVAVQGLSVLEWRVLASLAGSGPLTVRQLCERVLAQQPTVTKLLDRLQGQGLVAREPGQNDRRQTLVRLSADGEARVRPLLARAKDHEQQVLARLGKGDSQRLKNLLQGLLGP